MFSLIRGRDYLFFRLFSQVFVEKETVRNLEGVLAKQRAMEYVEKKSLETTIEEVDRLKDRLAKTDQEK